ncbi:hypothetical protein QJS10_CPA06g00518 [Acorus calamus]|uniref:Uncharacterized protein n=1 Tax=Acorus calamus TaxID=4465 RepID=A0AAV9EMF7_ACOCL|nr:hypothetical protein QJS10_CPA06g00518 [Acorus calamus]
MSSRRSRSRQSSSSRITDDQIHELVSKLQALLPETRSRGSDKKRDLRLNLHEQFYADRSQRPLFHHRNGIRIHLATTEGMMWIREAVRLGDDADEHLIYGAYDHSDQLFHGHVQLQEDPEQR